MMAVSTRVMGNVTLDLYKVGEYINFEMSFILIKGLSHQNGKKDMQIF
jgi:hypothetical protein